MQNNCILFPGLPIGRSNTKVLYPGKNLFATSIETTALLRNSSQSKTCQKWWEGLQSKRGSSDCGSPETILTQKNNSSSSQLTFHIHPRGRCHLKSAGSTTKGVRIIRDTNNSRTFRQFMFIIIIDLLSVQIFN